MVPPCTDRSESRRPFSLFRVLELARLSTILDISSLFELGPSGLGHFLTMKEMKTVRLSISSKQKKGKRRLEEEDLIELPRQRLGAPAKPTVARASFDRRRRTGGGAP
jgi:hypothetical protein